MDNTLKNKTDQPLESSLDKMDDNSAGKEDAHGNRAQEKIEDRATKKQGTREEAKSIAGSEPHKDSRNEHAGEGPAPLDRY
jgi:hypothetical protein